MATAPVRTARVRLMDPPFRPGPAPSTGKACPSAVMLETADQRTPNRGITTKRPNSAGDRSEEAPPVLDGHGQPGPLGVLGVPHQELAGGGGHLDAAPVAGAEAALAPGHLHAVPVAHAEAALAPGHLDAVAVAAAE